jgi:flagellin
MGSFSVLNNISGINAQNQLNINNAGLSRTLQRLASGKRINSGADDAAGLQIADTLRANVRALDQAVRNAKDGISVAQLADGALSELSSLLTRAVTLAEEAATETVDSPGRASLNNEFRQIEAEIARIVTQINFNGVPLLTATGGINGTPSIFVRDLTTNSSISVTITSITADGAAGAVSGLNGADLTTMDLTPHAGATVSLGTIKLARADVARLRAQVGAGINRLEPAVSVLPTQSQNSTSAESTIGDANMAVEGANLSEYQILTQTGIAAPAQTNAQSQSILTLFKR